MGAKSSGGTGHGDAGEHGGPVGGQGGGGESPATGGRAGASDDGGAAGAANTGGVAGAGAADGGGGAGVPQGGAPAGGDAGAGAASGATGDGGDGAANGGVGGQGASGAAGDGAGGARDCGEVIVNPGCADADPNTIDYQSVEFGGCLHWTDLGPGKGWIHYDRVPAFHYDLNTGLGWVLVTGSSLTRDEAEEFCEGYSVAGLSDWRLPTIDEARSLADGCANTAPGGSCPLDHETCLEESCGYGEPACTACKAGQGPHISGYCRAEAKICVSFHTTSSCPDCGCEECPPYEWRYSPVNGNFLATSSAVKIFPVCVMENIPRAIPCRD